MMKTALVCFVIGLLVVTEVTKTTVNAQNVTTATTTAPSGNGTTQSGNGAVELHGSPLMFQLVFGFAMALFLTIFSN